MINAPIFYKAFYQFFVTLGIVNTAMKKIITILSHQHIFLVAFHAGKYEQ